jgi:cytochrome P450
MNRRLHENRPRYQIVLQANDSFGPSGEDLISERPWRRSEHPLAGTGEVGTNKIAFGFGIHLCMGNRLAGQVMNPFASTVRIRADTDRKLHPKPA